MRLLSGKTALIFGVANKRSIAWGIAQAFHEQGAQLGVSYAGEVLEKRVKPLAPTFCAASSIAGSTLASAAATFKYMIG